MAVIEMPYAAYIALPDGGQAATPAHLAPLKKAVIDLVNAQVGLFRKTRITDIPGQAQSYDEKEKEARAFVAAGSPQDATIADFPYICREAYWTKQTPAYVANDIIMTADFWRATDARIESRRRGAATEILAAENIAQIVAAAIIEWAVVATTEPTPVV